MYYLSKGFNIICKSSDEGMVLRYLFEKHKLDFDKTTFRLIIDGVEQQELFTTDIKALSKRFGYDLLTDV